MATRQTTHEDLMKTMKGAFEKEFEDILPDAFATQSIGQTIKDLKSLRKNAAEEAFKQRVDQAIEFAEYIRLQQGTDEVIVPFLREQAIRVASWISRMSGRAPSLTIQNAGFKFSRVLENTFQNMDPFRTMRSAAFNLWMVLRPGRQILLQGAQISFLTALDPLYVASGRVFKDGILLRRGLMKLTKSNYDDGFNSKMAAKMMGLTQNQYKRLIQEVDRSGIIDTVDVHAFAGGAHRPKKSYDQPVLYTGKYLGKARQAMQTYGFDLGEQVNLANTFMVSLRRYMRENGVSDLMKLERSQWDEVAEDAMQLALGMTKPNKMWYQSGMVGTMTQFLTFSHRATLAMFGQNPALRPMDGFKIAMSGYLLFGSNMFGAGDWARSKLSAMGLDRFADKYIEGWGGTLVDLMAYGLIQNSFNAIMQATMDEFKDLDLGFLAPGVNIIQLYEELLKGVAEAPWGTALGPFGNVARGFVEGIDFLARIRQGSELSNADKAMRSADYLMRGIAPQYNDAMTSYMYYKTGTWANRSGRVLPAEFEGNWLNMMARASIGARSIEEMRFYYANNEIWENEENFRSVIKGNRDFLVKNLNLYYNGELNKDFLLNQLDMLVAWSEDWPPHLRDEILRQSLITENEDGVSPITIMAEKAKQLTPDIIAIIDELPEVQGGDKQALREALDEIYNQRIENNKVLMEDLKEDDGRWLN
jgi:hypothetical protein